MEKELEKGATLHFFGQYIYDVYKTSTGLFLDKNLCEKYGIGNPIIKKEIKDKICYLVTEENLDTLEKKAADNQIILKRNYLTIFDLQLVLTFIVYKDTNHDNKLYISNSFCIKYDITPISKRILNGHTYCNVTETDIVKIEQASREEKVIYKRKYVEMSLEDEVKPAENLFIYYYDMEEKKSYIQRPIYEICQKANIEIEKIPRIIENRNCYSITEQQLKEIERKTSYRGVERLLKPKSKESTIETPKPIKQEKMEEAKKETIQEEQKEEINLVMV